MTTRLTDDERAEILRLYRQGKSLRVTAGLVGRAYGTVHNVLVGAGVPRRPRGGYHRPGAR